MLPITSKSSHGLFIKDVDGDGASDDIYFQFNMGWSGFVKKWLQDNGGSDHGVTLVARLTWETTTGKAYQDFVFTDEMIAAVANSSGLDFFMQVTNYAELGISLDTLEVSAVIITDCGAESQGTVFTAATAVIS
jgi:hypothetical protein